MPTAYQDLMRRLAGAFRFIAAELRARRLPTAARERLEEIAEASAHVQVTASLSAVVVLAQKRSLVADMMELTGVDYLKARKLIPEME